MSDIVSVEPPEDETGLYVEPRELMARDLWTGARLWTAAQAFFFLTFVFAFFYLRSLNTNGMWKPHRVDPPAGYGGTILACILASAAIYALGTYAARKSPGVWRPAAGIALLLGVAAVVVQCVEWAAMSWGPTNGGFASVFVGWTGFYVLSLIGGLYWMETLVAESLRYRRDDEPRRGVVVRRANAEALGVYWTFLGAVAVIAFVLLYVVA